MKINETVYCTMASDVTEKVVTRDKMEHKVTSNDWPEPEGK